MDESTCRLAVCHVLAGKEVWDVKRRCSSSGTRRPLGEYLGVLDLGESLGCIECAFRLACGNASYCDNQAMLLSLRLEELKSIRGRHA